MSYYLGLVDVQLLVVGLHSQRILSLPLDVVLHDTLGPDVVSQLLLLAQLQIINIQHILHR